MTIHESSLCAGWSAIRPTEQDMLVISNNLAREILEHNMFGEKACGWEK